MKNYLLKFRVALLIIGFVILPVNAQLSELKILPDDSSRDQEFGHAVTVSGDYAAFSSIKGDDNGLLLERFMSM